MRFIGNAKPHMAASKDGCRPVLNGVLIAGDLSVVTDGRCLVVSEIGIEHGEQKPENPVIIPTKASMSACRQECTNFEISAGGDFDVRVWRSHDHKEEFKSVEGKYPNVGCVIPDWIFKEGNITGKSVSFDVDILARMCKASGHKKVSLFLDPSAGPTAPIVVGFGDRGSSSPESFGILMPMKEDVYGILAVIRDLATRIKKFFGHLEPLKLSSGDQNPEPPGKTS